MRRSPLGHQGLPSPATGPREGVKKPSDNPLQPESNLPAERGCFEERRQQPGASALSFISLKPVNVFRRSLTHPRCWIPPVTHRLSGGGAASASGCGHQCRVGIGKRLDISLVCQEEEW